MDKASKNSSLGIRLLRYVFGVYLIVTILITLSHVYVEFISQEENLFSKLESLGHSFEDGLSTALWNLDKESVDSIVLGMRKVVFVDGVVVNDQEGARLSTVGLFPESTKEHSILREIKIDGVKAAELIIDVNGEPQQYYQYTIDIFRQDNMSNKRIFIGALKIYAPQSAVYEQVKESFIVILVNAVIKSFALWLIFLFFVNHIVAKPLQSLTNATVVLSQSSSDGREESPTTLASILDSKVKDELYVLATSFVKMKDIILDKIQNLKNMNDIANRLKEEIEDYNRLLEDKVLKRTEEIEQKNRNIQAMLGNMQQGLLTIGGDFSVDKEYSKHTEDIFEQEKIEGKDIFELLFAGSELDESEIAQIKSAIFSIIDNDRLSFEFNNRLLVRRLQKKIGKKIKNLSLAWDTIEREEMVEKLLVTIQDVTQIEKMEADAKIKEREISIVTELINTDSFLECKQSVLSFHDRAIEFFRSYNPLTGKDKEKILREVHTLKGNVLTYGLKVLASAIHHAESNIITMLDSCESNYSPKECLGEIESLMVLLEEYTRVSEDILGRNAGGVDTLSITHKAAINDIKTYISDSVTSDDKELAIKYLNPILGILENSEALSLDDLLSNIWESLPSLADQLGKEPPEIITNFAGVKINKAYHNVLRDVLVHILRNSIDHGIEPPDERKQENKASKGRIDLNTEMLDGRLKITIQDDGRGINLARLYDKGVEAEVWSDESNPSKDEIAQLIFESGISTKSQASEISGRGIGMDAVRGALQDTGGSISIELLDGDCTEGYCLFKFTIDLPGSAVVQS